MRKHIIAFGLVVLVLLGVWSVGVAQAPGLVGVGFDMGWLPEDPLIDEETNSLCGSVYLPDGTGTYHDLGSYELIGPDFGNMTKEEKRQIMYDTIKGMIDRYNANVAPVAAVLRDWRLVPHALAA